MATVLVWFKMLSLIEKKKKSLEPMKSKCINIVIYFKTSNFVFSLYCASLLHTDRQYILSVCCLFINLKGTSKPTSFQTTVFKVEDFLERLKASQFSLFNAVFILQAVGFDVSVPCISMLHFWVFIYVFFLSACLVFVELMSEFTMCRDWKSRAQTDVKKNVFGDSSEAESVAV